MTQSKKVLPILSVILVLLAVGLVWGCSPSESGAASQTKFENLEQKYYSAIEEPFETVIKDKSSWDNFWSKLQGNQSETLPPPPVDFTEKMVVGVGLGTRNTGGYEIQIQEITVSNAQILVEYVERQPATNCMTTQALTQPYQLVLVDQSDLPVEFNSQTEIKNC
ncbi:MAG: protease complex subunit PrcB family protein [Coleofasciculaceae cyanobacterium]